MRAIAAMLLVLAVSCSDAPDVAFEQPSAPAEAWRHVQRVDGMLPQRAAAIALTDPEALSQAWAEHGFRGAPPRVDFADRFVLVLLQLDDGCPDELVRLEVIDRRLRVKWQRPPGGCIEPLIYRLHAIDVSRRHVPASFTVAVPPQYDDLAKPTRIRLR